MEVKYLLFPVRVEEQDIPEQHNSALGLVALSQMNFEVKSRKANAFSHLKYPGSYVTHLPLVFDGLYKKTNIILKFICV